jgi:LuxR family transcriptional regulator, maltose regulon positive regulatory protein
MAAGDVGSADHSLANAALAGEELGVDVATVALAERSILAMNRGDWQLAELLVDRARAAARPHWLEEYVQRAAARGTGPAGHPVRRRALGQERPRGRRSPAPQLTYALPHLAVQVRLELARTYLALTDVAAAKTALWEADSVLWQRPDLGLLRDNAEELRAQLGAMRQAPIGGSSLTPARGAAPAAAGVPLLVPGHRRAAAPLPAHREVACAADPPHTMSRC